MKIFIAPTSFCVNSEKPNDLLKNQQYQLSYNMLSRKINSHELEEYAKDVVGIIAGTEEYSSATLEKLPNLKVISRLGVGLDNLDLGYIKKKKIKLFKTKTTPALAVAELVLGLILILERKILSQHNSMKGKIWKKEMGSLLSGKTVGILGLGTIGKEFVRLSQGFNLKFLAYDIYTDIDFSKEYNITYTSLKNLLKSSDIITTHLNLDKSTKNIINKNNLSFMKSNSFLINASRGGNWTFNGMCTSTIINRKTRIFFPFIII